MKSFLYTIAILVAINVQVFAQPTAEKAIRLVLQNQVNAWNDGNVTQYMQAGYWQNDSLVFIGKKGLTYGYVKVLENYQKSYPDKAAMGNLQFEILSLQKLSKQCYFAIGKWQISRNGGDIGGSWTLLFKKINGAWKIVADHSS
jgi:ketosteroid isomerase-like protein